MRRLEAWLISGLTSLCLLTMAAPARAVDPLADACANKAAANPACQSSDASVNPVVHVIDIAVNILALAAGIGAVIMIMIAGFHLATSSGNPEKITKARSRIASAAIGLVVIALSWTIIHFVVLNFVK